MIRQLASLLILAAAAVAYPYYGGYAAPYGYHAPIAPLAYHAPVAAYHAPVYHAPVATSYHNTVRYPSYRAALPYYPAAGYGYAAAAYHAPIVPSYARYYRSAEAQNEQKTN